jgi:cysteinyl-tRNA synthetase
LSKQFNQLQGARIAIADYKENKGDFVLWKPSKLYEPYWNSSWGKGRPGWHIECSVMSTKFLGEKFDIHAGGQDLIFPHHENEQAQNIGLFGNYAGPRYWMHNAMVLFDNQKMSKSLGNVVRLSQAFAQYDPLLIRFFILSTHYRHVLMWKDENIMQAQSRYQRWLYHLREYIDDSQEICDEFYQALLNDLNVPSAIAIFENQLKEAVEKQDKCMLHKLANTMQFLGIIKKENINELNQGPSQDLNQKLVQRNIARARKDYLLADALRKEIEDAGFEIVDSYQASVLKKKI